MDIERGESIIRYVSAVDRMRYLVSRARLDLLPTGTTSNEALHAEVRLLVSSVVTCGAMSVCCCTWHPGVSRLHSPGRVRSYVHTYSNQSAGQRSV